MEENKVGKQVEQTPDVQEFKAQSIPELVMKAAEEYTKNGIEQLKEPFMEYISGIMKAAFFSGAYWYAHTDFTEEVMVPEEKKEDA